MRGIEGGCKLLCKYVNIVVSQLLHSPWGPFADGVVKMRIPFYLAPDTCWREGVLARKSTKLVNKTVKFELQIVQSKVWRRKLSSGIFNQKVC